MDFITKHTTPNCIQIQKEEEQTTRKYPVFCKDAGKVTPLRRPVSSSRSKISLHDTTLATLRTFGVQSPSSAIFNHRALSFCGASVRFRLMAPPYGASLWHSVRLLWTSDQPDAQTSYQHTTQYSQETNIHAAGGIRTHNLSKRAAADRRLRPRGHGDRLTESLPT